jgi:hypothetical protein
MEIRLCVCCGEPFRPRSQVPGQTYCSAPDCQKTRRRDWQRTKRQSDPDYRENQARAQRAWAEANPGYWSEYRRTHPEYTESNRVASQRRGAERVAKMDASKAVSPVLSAYRVVPAVAAEFAKMDASKAVSPVPSGAYRMVPAGAPEFAKMDAWVAEIILISRI